jgi:hypothetical protein
MAPTVEVPVLISRPRQLANLRREFELLLDGEPVARVGNGRCVTIPVTYGEHVVVAKIDWCRSRPVPLAVREDSEACLRVRCTVPWWALLVPFLIFVYIFVPGWYLDVEPA